MRILGVCVESRALSVIFYLNIFGLGIHDNCFEFVPGFLHETDLKDKSKDECSNKHTHEKQEVFAIPHCALEIETSNNKLKGTYSL